MVRPFAMSHVMAGRHGRVASDSDEFRISEPAARPVSVPLLDQRPVVPIEAIRQAAVVAQIANQTGLEPRYVADLLAGCDG